jgi:uncharacterized DUF497 family protein
LDHEAFRWSAAKNRLLRQDRSVSFEQVVVAIDGGLVDVLDHPNPAKYPNQRIPVVTWDQYVFLVPFVETGDRYFMNAVVPSRKATRDYLGRGEADGDD